VDSFFKQIAVELKNKEDVKEINAFKI